ncbi:MAG: hypothetical protein M0C28_20275 [Candidatus Moduliflexus flocculans]|nr:hypothetical protein [Candidatus Moduliflexus flocculans]
MNAGHEQEGQRGQGRGRQPVKGTCELGHRVGDVVRFTDHGRRGPDLHPRPLQHDAQGLRHDVQCRIPLGRGPPRHA